MRNLVRKAAVLAVVAWLLMFLSSLGQAARFQVVGQNAVARSSTAYVVPGEVVFATKEGTAPTAVARENEIALDTKRESRLLAKAHYSREFHIGKIPESQDLNEAIQRLREDPRIAYAEKHLLVPISPIKIRTVNRAIPTNASINLSAEDLRAELQWFLSKIQCPDGFSARTAIAVIDTGVTPASTQLQSAIIPGGYDFVRQSNDFSDFDGHGTAVAGEISGQYGMGSVPILPLRIVRGTDATGHTMLSLAAASDAIRYAVDHGARVLNMSFGAKGTIPQYFLEALRYAGSKGAIGVFAAGNDTNDNDKVGFLPANASLTEWNTISVAATNKDDALAWFSNWGYASVQIAAPGELIFAEQSTSTSYSFASGTSAAAPIVSALLAKGFDLYTMEEDDPVAQAKAAKEAVLSTGDTLDMLSGKVGSVSRVNLSRLIENNRNPQPEFFLPASFQVVKKKVVTLSGVFLNPQGVYANFVWQIDDGKKIITQVPEVSYKAKGVGTHSLSCTIQLFSGGSFTVTSTINVVKKLK